MIELVGSLSYSSTGPIVFVGRNRRGNWVALERKGTFGGLFVSRAQAVKFALFENGHHPEAIIEVGREIDLDTCIYLSG